MPDKLIRETDKFCYYKTAYGTERREQKFLCVGGPLDGQLHADTQIEESELQYKTWANAHGPAHGGYLRFNNSGGDRNAPNCVYVWLELAA